MRILILDDDPVRHAGFTLAYPEDERTHTYKYSEVVSALQLQGPWDLVYLDHDLGDFDESEVYDEATMYNSSRQEYTGADVAWFIARKLSQEKRPKKVIIHSFMEPGWC
jgi:hypothetical protein